MPVSDAKRRADAKYKRERRTQITLEYSKDQKAQINDYCNQYGGTAPHIKKLLERDMLTHGVKLIGTDEIYIPGAGSEG